MAGIFGLAKQFCRLASVLLLASSASLSAFAQGTSARVFMFHETKFYDGQVAATSDVYPDNFRDMLEFLARAGYNVIPVSQLVEWHKGNATIPTNAVVLTFDDNYIGNHQYAHPIMQELVMPGTFFAHTGYVGVPTSRDHGTWAQLDFCEKWGLVTCESHTVTHPYLTQTSNLTYELVNSKQAIESNLGKTCRYLAYPFGDYNSTVIAAAQAAGYEAAFTTKGGLNYLTTPRYELNRNGIGIVAQWKIRKIGMPRIIAQSCKPLRTEPKQQFIGGFRHRAVFIYRRQRRQRYPPLKRLPLFHLQSRFRPVQARRRTTPNPGPT